MLIHVTVHPLHSFLGRKVSETRSYIYFQEEVNFTARKVKLSLLPNTRYTSNNSGLVSFKYISQWLGRGSWISI